MDSQTGRTVSAEEAQGITAAILADGEPTRVQRQRLDLANTVVVQAEQIAAVLALHTSPHWCVGRNYVDTLHHTCETTRALGVSK